MQPKPFADWIEDYRRNKAKNRHKMSEEFEGRWRMQEEEISRLARSRSSSLHVDISHPGSVEEMGQQHYKLGAKTKWSAHADWPDLSEDSSTTPIPPWRDKSIWRITTTKTVAGLLSDQPNQGAKHKFQGMYEALSRKHAMEYARLTKDYEEMTRASEKEEEVTKDEELHRKMEEMLSMMKDLADKANVCTSDPRYQDMLSFMTEKARRDMKERAVEDQQQAGKKFPLLAKAARRKTRHKGTWSSNLPLCCQTEVKTKKRMRPASSWELTNPS